MQLIVAEKPSVARDLARVLGVRPSGQHGFEGTGRVITWCVGHLVELDEPAAYDPRWRAWRLDTLPMLPAEFRLRPASHAAAQLRAVTKLLCERRFTSVVNACDAGREGELIFRYVYRFAGARLPVHRLWISSLTDEAIRRGFAALRPAAQLDALGDAARSRSEADWLVGMNATRAITARGREAGHSALYSIGRVQTPTLAMLVGREQAIRAFVPRDYWEVRGDFRTAEGERFSAGWRRGDVARLGTAALAEAIVARDHAHRAAGDPLGPRVERIRARTVREPPPLLFDLTSLQRTANRRFGWSAARTLELAQALYERHKVLTYPRTDARHLSSDMIPELPALFRALGAVPEYAPFAAELLARPPRIGRRIVDDAKVSDHHAIIPTGKAERLDGLDRDERRLFDLVARRFLGAFYPDAEIAITEAWIRVGAVRVNDAARALPGSGRAPDGNGDQRGRPPDGDGDRPILEALPPAPDRYLARGRVRIAAGWQAVAGIDGDDRRGGREGERDGEPTTALPPLVEGQPLDGAFASVARQTTPPPRYSEATLLGAMESAGKAIDDDGLRAAMKDCGLGTPATRASIIETLLRRDYIVRVKQHLVPTPMGIGLIEGLPVASLASPELTGMWEARLARIARGEDSRDAFMADIARYVEQLVDAIRGSPPPVAPVGNGAEQPAARSWSRDQGRGRARRGRGGSDEQRAPGSFDQRSKAQRSRARSKSPRANGSRTNAASSRASGPARAASPRANGPARAASPRTNGPAATIASRQPRTSALATTSRAKSARTTAESPHTNGPAAPRLRAADLSRSRTGASATAPRSTPAAAPAPILAELGCPRCHQGTLIAGSRGWGCSRWRDGCRFVVWFETAGRRLSAAQLRDLITRGKTRKTRFVSERGDEIDGRLVLDPAADGGCARLVPA